MDVNEKIVNCWLQNCKETFTMYDVEYDNYHSAIDILGVDLKSNIVYDIEVKFKAKIKIADSDKKQNGYRHITKQLLSKEREKVIQQLLSNKFNYTVKRIFVTTKRFLSVNKFDYWQNRFLNDGIEVWFFDDIVSELSELSSNLNKANDEILQSLRMFNQFRNDA